MKTVIMFAVASLMLVGAVIVFALPTPVQAAKHQWCTQNSSGTACFEGKGKCEKYVKEHPELGLGPCTQFPR